VLSLSLPSVTFAAGGKKEIALAQEAGQAWLDRTVAIGGEPLEWIGAHLTTPQVCYDLKGKPNAYMFAIENNGEIVGYMIVGSSAYGYPMLEAADVPPPSIPSADESKSILERDLGLKVEKLGKPTRLLYLGFDNLFAVYQAGGQELAVNLKFDFAIPASDLTATMPSPEDYRANKESMAEAKPELLDSSSSQSLVMPRGYAWVSPTGHNDPSNSWGYESYAYDDNTDSRATAHVTGDYLELTHSAIYCDKVRIYATSFSKGKYYDPTIDIDVYYSGAWHNIWSGYITKKTWVEKAIGSTQSVTAARVKCNLVPGLGGFGLYEFDFNSLPSPPLVMLEAKYLEMDPHCSGWCGPASGVSIGQYYRDECDYDKLPSNANMYSELYQLMGTAFWYWLTGWGATMPVDYGPGFVAMTEDRYDNFSYYYDAILTGGDYWNRVADINSGWPIALGSLIQLNYPGAPDKGHWVAIRGYLYYQYSGEPIETWVRCTDSYVCSDTVWIDWNNIGFAPFTVTIKDS